MILMEALHTDEEISNKPLQILFPQEEAGILVEPQMLLEAESEKVIV